MTTTIKERPILFSGPMVRAILAGRKTQTRRVIDRVAGFGNVRTFQESTTTGYQWQFRCRRGLWQDFRQSELLQRCPYGQTGDRLWVREAFWQASYYPSTMPCGEPSPQRDNWGSLVKYAADGNPENTPNRHYPNGLQGGAISAPNPYATWLKRPSIHMPRKRCRIELEITDVRVERLNDISEADALAEGVEPTPMNDAKVVFDNLWVSINGPSSVDANPWVWVLEFKQVR